MCGRLKQIIIIHYVNVTDAGRTPARTHINTHTHTNLYAPMNALEYMNHGALEYAAMQLCCRTRSGRCHKQFNLFQLLLFPTASGTVPIAITTAKYVSVHHIGGWWRITLPIQVSNNNNNF